MEYIIFLYIFFTGCVSTAYVWETTDIFCFKLMNILFGFITGWFVAPILIGRAIKQIIVYGNIVSSIVDNI